VAEDHVFPIAVDDAAIAALAEPISIGVRAVHRARIEEGERVVVLGAGPIGQSVCLAARDREASVLVVDPLERRLGMSCAMGAEAVVWTDADDVIAHAREWSGGEGPPVVVDATGVPQAVRAAVDMAASAGRVVQVGMSVDEVGLRIGSFTEKELDMLGVSCCGGRGLRPRRVARRAQQRAARGHGQPSVPARARAPRRSCSPWRTRPR